LKSRATTDTLENIYRLSIGRDSILRSTKSTIDSIPPVVRGSTDSYAAISAGPPFTGAPLPLAGGAAFAGAFAAAGPPLGAALGSTKAVKSGV